MCPNRPPLSAATTGENEEESEFKRNGMKFSMPQRSHVQVDGACRRNSLHLGLQETGRGPFRGHELKRSRSMVSCVLEVKLFVFVLSWVRPGCASDELQSVLACGKDARNRTH